MELNHQLGRAIKKARVRVGKDIAGVAQALGKSYRAVYRWERGECYPDYPDIAALAAHYGLTPGQLVDGRCPRKRAS